MIKVQILTTCDFCEGDAYLPDGEAESYTGEKYTRYKPCPCCDGSGKRTKWIDLKAFAELLEKANAFEPDYQELSQHKPITQYQDSCDAAGIP